jgi:hypothetical protein
MADCEPPVLTAVSSSARQLFMLLRCIAFSSKAHVTISEEGLKLAVNDASVMEGKTSRADIVRAMLTCHSICLPRQVSLHHIQLPRAHTPARLAGLRR